MRACSSPLLVHTIFSWSPARAQGTSTRSQGSHTVLPQGMNALCQFKAKSLGLFQFKSCFSTCVPFPFAARSAKGPISPHCIGTAQKDSQQLTTALVSPFSPAPKAAQCCHHVPGAQAAASARCQARPAAGSSASSGLYMEKGRQTPSYQARSLNTGDRHSVILLSPSSSKRPATQTCYPTRWNGTGGARLSEVVRQHRPPAAKRNAEQEHRTLQITESFSCTPLCSTNAIFEVS